MTIELVGAILMHLAIFAHWPYFAQSCTAKYFYGKMSSVAPTNSRTCYSEIETEKKRNETNTRRDLNPWSLDHKACALQLLQNYCSRICTWFCTLKKILDQILTTWTAFRKFCFIILKKYMRSNQKSTTNIDCGNLYFWFWNFLSTRMFIAVHSKWCNRWWATSRTTMLCQ